MAVIHFVQAETLLPGGEKLIRGKLTIGAHAAGGAALNLANYLKDDQVPTVFVGTVANATNVAFPTMVNTSNAESIKILCMTGGLGAEQPLYMLNAGFELTAQNVDFYALGRAY